MDGADASLFLQQVSKKVFACGIPKAITVGSRFAGAETNGLGILQTAALYRLPVKKTWQSGHELNYRVSFNRGKPTEKEWFLRTDVLICCTKAI